MPFSRNERKTIFFIQCSTTYSVDSLSSSKDSDPSSVVVDKFCSPASQYDISFCRTLKNQMQKDIGRDVKMAGKAIEGQNAREHDEESRPFSYQ